MLNRFGMTKCNPLSTPMEQNLKLTSIEGKEFEDATKYRQLVGSFNVMKPTHKKIEKIDRQYKNQPLRGRNLLYITQMNNFWMIQMTKPPFYI